jgi:plastocyanin
VELRALEYRYEPDELLARPNEALRIRLLNIGAAPHDVVFELDGREARSGRVPAGGMDTVSFTAPAAPGRYTYYCSVGNHRSQGMEGTLVIGGGAGPDRWLYLPYGAK